MEMNIVPNPKNWSIRLSHRDRVMVWPGAPYAQKPLVSPEKWVELLNMYWRDLTDTEQCYIYDCYAKIADIVDGNLSVAESRRMVMLVASDLMVMHPEEQMLRYVKLLPYVYRPDDLRHENELELPVDKLYSRELTYTVDDYEELLIFTASMRVLAPVFCRYLPIANIEAGKIKPRVYTAMLPIVEATWLSDSTAYHKLIDYVEATLANAKGNAKKEQGSSTLTMAGITDREIELLFLSSAVILRITRMEYSVEGLNIVSEVYNRSDNLLMNLHKRVHEAPIRNKFLAKDSSDEGNTSTVETYQISQQVTDMVHLSIESYLSRYIAFAKLLVPTINTQLVREALKIQQSGNRTQVTSAKIYLLSVVVRKEIPYKTLRLLNLETMLKLIAVTQVVLYHRGHHLLAVMLGSDTMTSTKEYTFKNIPTAKVKILNDMYPHYKPSERSRKNIPIGKAYCGIISQAIQEHQYHPLAPQEMLESLPGRDNPTDVIEAPLYLRELVADLIIDFLS